MVVVGVMVVINKVSGPSSEEVKIGVVLPLTGTSADNGENMKRGLDLALKEINDNSRTEHKVKLIYENSEYKSDKAVAAANKLISLDGVKFIIGDYGSSQTLAIAPIAEKSRVILITPSSQADGITEAGDYVFRTSTSAKQEAKLFSQYVFDKIGNTELGILALNTDYGVSYIKEYSSNLQSLGGAVGLVQKYETTDNDFRQFLLKFKEVATKDILLIGNRKSNGLILKTAKELKMPFTFFGTSPTEGEELIKVAGAAADGLIYPYPFDDSATSSAVLAYQEKYQAAYDGKKGEMISSSSYDALKILSQCFESVGSNVEAVKKCLYDTKNYDGASGLITFDSNGDVSKPFILKVVKDGQFVKLEQ